MKVLHEEIEHIQYLKGHSERLFLPEMVMPLLRQRVEQTGIHISLTALGKILG